MTSEHIQKIKEGIKTTIPFTKLEFEIKDGHTITVEELIEDYLNTLLFVERLQRTIIESNAVFNDKLAVQGAQIKSLENKLLEFITDIQEVLGGLVDE